MWLPARFRNQLDFRFAFCFSVDAVPDRKMLHLDLGSARRAGPSNRINHFPPRKPKLTVGARALNSTPSSLNQKPELVHIWIHLMLSSSFSVSATSLSIREATTLALWMLFRWCARRLPHPVQPLLPRQRCVPRDVRHLAKRPLPY